MKRAHIAVLQLTCLAMLGHTGAARAATITVGPGQSIQNAVNTAIAGDTVRVLAGTYSEKIRLDNKNGSAGNFITLKGEAGVILSGTGLVPVDREGLITITNSNYVRVEGFDVANFLTGGASTPVGILVEGKGSNIQIVNNKIHNIQHTSKCKEPCAVGAHGLAVFGTNATGITDLLVQGNEVYGNVLQSSEALVINGNVDRFEVLANNVHDNNNIGFDFIGYEGECSGCGENDRVRNGIVRGNTAKNNSSKSNPWYAKVGSAGGFYVDGGRNIIFDRNISTGNDIGFEFASEHKGKATEDILMMNNFIFNNREAGLSLGGYSTSAGASRRIQVHNNSFYKNQGWGTELLFQYKVTDSRFSNNIFFGENSAEEAHEIFGSGHSNNVFGKNIWWGTSTEASSLPGTKVVADPKFVAPATGNLRLQAASPAINAGAVSAAVTNWTSPLWTRYFPSGVIAVNGVADINGQSRAEGAIDLGADEFGTAAAAAITAGAPR